MRLCLFLLTALLIPALATAAKRPFTFDELMKFRQIEDVVLSDDGAWVAYQLKPDRGDGEGVVRATAGETEYRIARGADAVIGADSRWAVFAVEPTLEALGSRSGTARRKNSCPRTTSDRNPSFR